MTYEERSGSLLDDERIIVSIPEADVGTDAASIAARTGVCVRVVPETLRTVTVVPETS